MKTNMTLASTANKLKQYGIAHVVISADVNPTISANDTPKEFAENLIVYMKARTAANSGSRVELGVLARGIVAGLRASKPTKLISKVLEQIEHAVKSDPQYSAVFESMYTYWDKSNRKFNGKDSVEIRATTHKPSSRREITINVTDFTEDGKWDVVTVAKKIARDYEKQIASINAKNQTLDVERIGKAALELYKALDVLADACEPTVSGKSALLYLLLHGKQ